MAREWKRIGNDFDIGFHPVLAKPLFNDSDTATRGSAPLKNRANPQVVRKAWYNFRKDDDVRWQYTERPLSNL